MNPSYFIALLANYIVLIRVVLARVLREGIKMTPQRFAIHAVFYIFVF